MDKSVRFGDGSLSSVARFQRRKRKPPIYKRKSVLFAVVLAALLFIAVYAVLNTNPLSSNQETGLKAVIIDQLSATFPNTTFWWRANYMFNQSGWRMYYFTGGGPSDTVSSYRTLPKQGFKIIILRVHGALNPSTGTLALFTSEKWDDWKASTEYITDFDPINPENNKLAKVRINETSQAYFGITPNFVKAMQGDFEGATIIMMGCDGIVNTKMAEAFVEKGAKAYIAWTGPVSAAHTDSATQELLNYLVAEKNPIGTAVGETANQVGNDPDFGSTISYYPFEAGDSKVWA